MDVGSLNKSTLTAQEYEATKNEVTKINSKLNNGKGYKLVMGQEEFLRLLTEELKYQDPTQPLKDRDFIAQMAQISQLDQVAAMKNEITVMNKEINNVSRLIEKNNALSLLGKVVDIVEGSGIISGTVEEIVGGDFPQLLVNGKYYDYQNVSKFRNK
jgi:flagellar basal-body rod modification protein FlgD